VSLHDEMVAIRTARFIIEQALIHRSEARRAVSGVRVFFGKGQRPHLHQPWVWGALNCGGPEQSLAAKQMSSAVLPESCSTRFMCTGDSAKYGVAKFSLWGHCPLLPLTGYRLKNTAWYHLESPYSNTISDYYYR